MTRLGWGAFGANSILADGLTVGSGVPTVVASPFTGGGAFAMQCVGTTTFVNTAGPPAASDNRGYYLRARVRISGAPAVNTGLLGFGTPSVSVTSNFGIGLAAGSSVARLFAGGAFRGANGPTLAANTDYLLEVYAMYNQVTTLTDFVGGRVDGVDIDTTQSAAWTTATNVPSFMGIASNVAMTAHFTDWALNDDQGADNNSWCGDARVAMLVPASDDTGNSFIAADGWRAGNTGTTSLFAAVDNKPPTGAASPGTTTSQIVVDTPSVARSYVGVTGTYTAAGIAAGDTITLVQGMVWHAESVNTGTKTGTIDLFANPSTSTQAITFGNDVGLAAAWPTSWFRNVTPLSVAPTPTRGTGASIRVTADISTRNSDVCFMGVYVEYTLAVAASGPPPPFPLRRIEQRIPARRPN